MDAPIDARQIERVLSHLARLRRHRDRVGVEALDQLRPPWLGPDAWEIILEELETQHYRERKRAAQLRLVR